MTVTAEQIRTQADRFLREALDARDPFDSVQTLHRMVGQEFWGKASTMFPAWAFSICAEALHAFEPHVRATGMFKRHHLDTEPPKEGFAPEPMPLARARVLVGACCRLTFYTMGVPMQESLGVGVIEHVSLEELLEANRILDAENKRAVERQSREGGAASITTVCDPRLVAAVYCAMKYQADDPADEIDPLVRVPLGGGYDGVLIFVKTKPAADRDADE